VCVCVCVCACVCVCESESSYAIVLCRSFRYLSWVVHHWWCADGKTKLPRIYRLSRIKKTQISISCDARKPKYTFALEFPSRNRSRHQGRCPRTTIHPVFCSSPLVICMKACLVNHDSYIHKSMCVCASAYPRTTIHDVSRSSPVSAYVCIFVRVCSVCGCMDR